MSATESQSGGMILHWSPRSPFVRKAMIVAQEKGLADRIRCVRTVVSAMTFNETLVLDNPLGKIPTLVLEDGQSIFDSGAICDYFESLAPEPARASWSPERRRRVRRREAIGDGLMQLLVNWGMELMRPEACQWKDYLNANERKFRTIIAALERELEGSDRERPDVGALTIACALSYADFRFDRLRWRDGYPRLAEWFSGVSARPSFIKTAFAEG